MPTSASPTGTPATRHSRPLPDLSRLASSAIFPDNKIGPATTRVMGPLMNNRRERRERLAGGRLQVEVDRRGLPSLHRYLVRDLCDPTVLTGDHGILADLRIHPVCVIAIFVGLQGDVT